MTSTDALRQVPLFSGLDDQVLAHVAGVAAEFTAPAGHVLAEKGHAGSGVFILESGTVTVETATHGVVELGPGDVVGELAVLTEHDRSARVRAVTEVSGLAIRRADLLELLETEPALTLALLRVVADRLASA